MIKVKGSKFKAGHRSLVTIHFSRFTVHGVLSC